MAAAHWIVQSPASHPVLRTGESLRTPCHGISTQGTGWHRAGQPRVRAGHPTRPEPAAAPRRIHRSQNLTSGVSPLETRNLDDGQAVRVALFQAICRHLIRSDSGRLPFPTIVARAPEADIPA